MNAGWPILSVPIASEADVVIVRQRARRIAELVGFDRQDQTRVATAVSEIARNAFEYARGGKASFRIEPGGHGKAHAFVVTISDKGPGIADVDAILEGRLVSRHGMGVGIIGARKLVDDFEISSTPGLGTTVELGKRFTRHRPPVTRAAVDQITAQLVREPSGPDLLAVLADQNRELLGNMDDLRNRQEEMARLNRELEDTNRGVVALYAELDERAEQLKQASELKSRFLSNMSHEFRTPVNSILALAELLIDRVDGELTVEQERQVGFIKRSAESLAELVNDLLDLAKVEAGKLEVRPTSFTVGELFGGLRGALRPLQKDKAADLVFEAPATDLPGLMTDEAKVGQILRNLISNALKFTPAGEVHVAARLDRTGERILFAVRDTGIGIAHADHERIFEEFSQVENPMQRRVKGTGLGLPLSRRLAELLQGDILVESELGHGSTFTLVLPLAWQGSIPAQAADQPTIAPEAMLVDARLSSAQRLILIVDDDEEFRYALRQMIGAADRSYEVAEAVDGSEGLARARELTPDAIVLDLQMPILDGYAVLARLATDPRTSGIPVLISSSATLDEADRRRLAAAHAFLPKSELTRETVRAALDSALGGRP